MQRRSFFALLASAIAAPLAALGITRKTEWTITGADGTVTRLREGPRVYGTLNPTGSFRVPWTFSDKTDARAWARFFVAHVRTIPQLATDEATMTTWFANAIEHGRDAGLKNGGPWKAKYHRACDERDHYKGVLFRPHRDGYKEEVEDLRRERDYYKGIVERMEV